MPGKPFRVIAYDIASDRHRRKMEALVQRYAERKQDSVYEGWLSDTDVARLMQKARPLIDPATDSLRIYRLCARCQPEIVSLGGEATHSPPGDIIV